MKRFSELWTRMWRRPWGRWAGALLLTALAFGLRLALMPWIGTRAPFALFYPAILIAGWFGGLGAGILSLVVSVALSVVLIEPVGTFFIGLPGDRWSIVLFAAVATIMLAVGEGARRARSASDAARHEAHRIRATLEQALESARMGYWTWEFATNDIRWSDSVETVHGVPLGSFAGTFESFLPLVHPDDRGIVQEAIAKTLADGSDYHVEYRVPQRNGKNEWVAGDGRVEIEDGKPVRMTGIAMNVTARREADEDRRLLASIVDSSDDAIISKDLEGRLLSWNRAAERMFGYTAEEAIGQSVAMLLPPERADEFYTNMDRVRRGVKVVHHETLRRRKDGTVFETALTISPIHDDTGRIMGASKIGRDISAVKQAERERQRTSELFLGILGHDLRNPLNTIVASLFVLEKEVPESAKRLLPRVSRSAQRMGRMIDQLLDFTRARLGQGIPVSRTPGDLREILRAMVEELEPAYAGRLKFSADGAVPGLWDADRLQQAVSNLVVNGLKHGAAGEPVEVRVAPERDAVTIEVVNSGTPIPDTEVAHIFEPFRRLTHEPTRDSSGLGLGLYIVREIVTAHGGGVDVDSTPERTAFRVRLPVVSHDGVRSEKSTF
jgi:PAS domain S-box-containing protein